MRVAPLPAGSSLALAPPIAVRLIGALNRELLEAFSAACADALAAGGARTLIVVARDLLAVRDDAFHRFVARLIAYRGAGHDVLVAAPAGWTKLLRDERVTFAEPSPADLRATRRQIIIALSGKTSAGASLTAARR